MEAAFTAGSQPEFYAKNCIMERRMDNRLGERISIKVSIGVLATRPQTISTGYFINLSRSGALISHCDLQPYTFVFVVLKSHQRPQHDAGRIGAYVTRLGDDGVGIEWCEFAPPAVVAVMQAARLSDAALLPPRDFGDPERTSPSLRENYISSTVQVGMSSLGNSSPGNGASRPPPA